MTPTIRFIGRSGSGKTTLLTGVVRALVHDGVRVAVLKHAHHRVDLDRKGKDSFRFAEAGAAFVAVISPEKVATFEAPSAAGPSLEHLVARIPHPVDVVLAEGFHDSSSPYFLLLDRRSRSDDRPSQGELIGAIEADETSNGALHRSDPAAVAVCVKSWLAVREAQTELERLLDEALAFHGHMCPGQLLGVRLAVVGCRAVDLPQPRGSKKLIVWVEIDRCGADAIQTVTGCKLGKRSLKFVDNGKLAATFLNTETGRAVRVVARADSRDRAAALYPDMDRHEAQMRAYRELPDAELFAVQPVAVEVGAFDRPGKPAVRVRCSCCHEEVNDGRHVEGDDGPLCRSCAGGAYYRVLGSGIEMEAER